MSEPSINGQQYAPMPGPQNPGPPPSAMGQQNYPGSQSSGYQMQSNAQSPMTNTSGPPNHPMYHMPPTSHSHLSNSPIPSPHQQYPSPIPRNNQNVLSNAPAPMPPSNQNLMSNIPPPMPPSSQNVISSNPASMPPTSQSSMSSALAHMPPSSQNMASNAGPPMPPSSQNLASSAGLPMPPTSQQMSSNAGPAMPPTSQHMSSNAGPPMPPSSQTMPSNVRPPMPPSLQTMASSTGPPMQPSLQTMMTNIPPQMPPSSQNMMSNTSTQMQPGSQSMMPNTSAQMPPTSQSMMSNASAHMPPSSQNMGPNVGPPMPPGSQNMASHIGPPMPPSSQNMASHGGPPMPPTSQSMTSHLGSPMPPSSQNMPSTAGQSKPPSSQNIMSNTSAQMPPTSQSMMSSAGAQMPPTSQSMMPGAGAQMLPTSQSMMSNTSAHMPPSSQNMGRNVGPPMPPSSQNMASHGRPPMPPSSQNMGFNTGPQMAPNSQNMMSNTASQMPPSSQNIMSHTSSQMPPTSQGMMSNIGAQMPPGPQHMMSNPSAQMPPGPQNMMPNAPNQPPMYPVEVNGQSHMQSLPGYRQTQPGRHYPAAPPMSGQTMRNPGPSRPMPPPMGNYQQGGYPQQEYHNLPDMYRTQRGHYQGGPMSPAGNYQPEMEPQQARRLDPAQMPNPIQVMEDDECLKGGVFRTNQLEMVPPLVTTTFVAEDLGNASPRFIRSTMYTVPTTADFIKQTKIPFAVILNPLARVEKGEFEPPIVNMGEIGPIRCVRCKAYMCPYMDFIDDGRRFLCLFCKATTEVPPEYFQHLNYKGYRLDHSERAELMLGTYEYIATKEYCRNNVFPKPPAIIFVIDVSYNNVKSGLVNLLCMKMKSILKNLPVDVDQQKSNMKVGFITYNNTVHFYNIKPCLAQPQMMVVGDVQDVFMPLLDGFLCDIEESETVIDSLMTQIPAMFGDTREIVTVLAPAIRAGLEALKASECCGKLIVFHSSLPIAEAPGKLKNRDDRKLLGTDKEKSVLAPQNNVYNNLGQECVDAGCSVDLFVCNNSYVDIATIGQVCRLTGGEVYKYTYFQADVDGDRLVADVITNISRPIAFDARMRLRTSTGVRATDFYGHFFMSNTTEIELASIDCDKAVAVEIKHDDKLTDGQIVYIQAALLYTSCGGVRRLRIINLSLKSSSQMTELYRICELDAIINYFIKRSVSKLIESTPRAVKDNLISTCANILAAYRKNCASTSNAGQLILPECMKLLPLYLNCMLKSDALSGGPDMTIDDRSFVMYAVTTMPIPMSVVYIYPRIQSLHDVNPFNVDVPEVLRCSFDKFTEDGAYLLDNSVHMFLWLGLGLSSQWVQDVFGVPSVVDVDTDCSSLPVLGNAMSKKIRGIIDDVRNHSHRCLKLTVVRQREKLEMVLRHFLVEDRGNDGSPSYVDFLCHMHSEIKEILNP